MDNIDGGQPQRGMGEKIALALQGFGAGVQGQGPYFQHMLNQQDQQLSEGRKMALVQDAYSVQQHLQSGNIPTARATLINRLQAIKKLGGDPSDTMGVLQKVESGDIPGALQDVSTVVNFLIHSSVYCRFFILEISYSLCLFVYIYFCYP